MTRLHVWLELTSKLLLSIHQTALAWFQRWWIDGETLINMEMSLLPTPINRGHPDRIGSDLHRAGEGLHLSLAGHGCHPIPVTKGALHGQLFVQLLATVAEAESSLS